MGDALIICEGLVVCVASGLSREAGERHKLAAGSEAALGQALTGALLLAATQGTRVDIQLECPGPLRGFLVDAEPDGAARGLVRVNDLGAEAMGRFDPRPLLATPFDERAGVLSIVSAQHRAVLPFAGANLGAALTFHLRNLEQGELALEVLFRDGIPLVAGALLAGADLGHRLRKLALHAAMLRADTAQGIAEELAKTFELGPLSTVKEVQPRFACRCSRERFVRALRTLGAAELRDMAGRDGGASASCDFCSATYRISAEELLALASSGRPT